MPLAYTNEPASLTFLAAYFLAVATLLGDSHLYYVTANTFIHESSHSTRGYGNVRIATVRPSVVERPLRSKSSDERSSINHRFVLSLFGHLNTPARDLTVGSKLL